jgi:hypothetical protein
MTMQPASPFCSMERSMMSDMIIVLEGPTAAGKTTWGLRHAGAVLVPETGAASEPPAEVETAARFWAESGAERWKHAIEIESRAGVAVCDTDPLKLHYSWSLCRIGVGNANDFWQQAAAYREMIASSQLGFADRYFVAIPDRKTLETRRAIDLSRRRRNFDLHARLGTSLREWYSAVEELRPGSVTWQFPEDGTGGLTAVSRPRHDLETFDALVEHLAKVLP